MRVFFKECRVALAGAQSDKTEEALLNGAEMALYHQAEHPLQLRNIGQKPGLALRREQQQLAGFQGLNEHFAGCLLLKTHNIAYPPVFGSKRENQFFALFVYVISFNTTFQYKCLECAHLACAQEKMLGRHTFLHQKLVEMRQLSVAERRAGAEVLVYGFVGHAANIVQVD